MINLDFAKFAKFLLDHQITEKKQFAKMGLELSKWQSQRLRGEIAIAASKVFSQCACVTQSLLK